MYSWNRLRQFPLVFQTPRGIAAIFVFALALVLFRRASFASGNPAIPSAKLAPTPPLGWNSYDSFGGVVNEAEFRANAQYVARHLARYGWNYVVVDYYWYLPQPDPAEAKASGSSAVMDSYGRLLPDPVRFPSAAGGKGFKPLADYVHSLGLKFGIHIMRGIPRAAVEKNLPVRGVRAHARDIADLENSCSWSNVMDGVDVSKAAGQAYYDSITRLYARWGVDYIKADDMSRAENPKGETFHGPEIQALRMAMNKTDRPMVLSLSPGPTQLINAPSVMRWSQLWRISNDMWDNWKELKQQFDFCRDWAHWSGPGHWPDADMLPLGRLCVRGFKDQPRDSRLTHDEQITMMTLWSIFRSPLMMGGDLRSIDPFTLSLLTNPEVIAVDQASHGGHEVFRDGGKIAWEADAPEGRGRYVALFNTSDQSVEVSVTWKQLGLGSNCRVRDLWLRKNVGSFASTFAVKLEAHGAGLYRATPAAGQATAASRLSSLQTVSEY
jgi:alpha-galactosidase